MVSKSTYPATIRLLSIPIARRFKVKQIYYILYSTANKDKEIYRELLIIQDATALYRWVAIKFYIFKDVKTRVRCHGNKEEQYPNAEAQQNPYNNILDDLFKDLDNKSIKYLKATI